MHGVGFRDLLVVPKILGSIKAFFQDRLHRLNKFGAGDMPCSVRRGSHRYYTGNSTATAKR